MLINAQELLCKPILQFNLLTTKELQRAAAKAQTHKQRLLSHLIQTGLLSSEQIKIAVANYYGLPEVNLNGSTKLQSTLIPSQMMRDHWIIAIGNQHTAHSMHIAFCDPQILLHITTLEFQLGRRITPHIANFSDIISCISNHLYQHSKLDANQSTPNLVDHIISDAIHRNASDIHFEPFNDYYSIRIRVDGLLHEVTRFETSISNNIASRIKILANLDISEQRRPQDGRLKFTSLLGIQRDCRINSCPTMNGEKIVLRILNGGQSNMHIEDLGMDDQQQQQMLSAIQKPQGLVLVTGPTGSGKSITLYAALQHLNKSTKNISTVEDPIELQIAGINQIQVNQQINLGFADALRALLRQDPDIIMIGEIRDNDTAKIAIRAAQTGHLVLATLHANTTLEAITRLELLGISTEHITQSVSLIIAQRLMRCLCPHCKGHNDQCQYCWQGYLGRTGVFEMLEMNTTLRQMIHDKHNKHQLQRYLQDNCVTSLWQAGMAKVAAHVTSLSELKRCVNEEQL